MKFSSLLLAACCVATVLFSQCKHTKYTPESLPDRFLRFGYGGGFTGAVTEYSLYDSGQLFRFAAKAPQAEEVACTKTKNAVQLFETARSLNLLDREFSYPGNTYSFIEFRDGGKQRRITWGDNQHPVEPAVQELYDRLVKLAPKRK